MEKKLTILEIPEKLRNELEQEFKSVSFELGSKYDSATATILANYQIQSEVKKMELTTLPDFVVREVDAVMVVRYKVRLNHCGTFVIIRDIIEERVAQQV